MEENKEEQVKNTEEKAIEIKQETAIASQEEQTDQTEKIEISNDVIAVIAGVAVSEVQGVAGMSGGFAGGISEVLSEKKNLDYLADCLRGNSFPFGSRNSIYI